MTTIPDDIQSPRARRARGADAAAAITHFKGVKGYRPCKQETCKYKWRGAGHRGGWHSCQKVRGYHDHHCRCGDYKWSYDTIVRTA